MTRKKNLGRRQKWWKSDTWLLGDVAIDNKDHFSKLCNEYFRFATNFERNTGRDGERERGKRERERKRIKALAKKGER